MVVSRCEGLIAAALTPFDAEGKVSLNAIPLMVDWLVRRNVTGLYVCGSSGEGQSLSREERQQVSSAYIQAAAGRLPVIVHVGHPSLQEARQLALHAASVGATAISAAPPSYFPIHDVETLVGSVESIATAAPELPFYYCHIPAMTHIKLPMPAFIHLASQRIGNFAGLKFTAPEVDEFQECLVAGGGKYNIMWGLDEMLLPALSVGARAAIGRTFTLAAPLYQQLVAAFREGDWGHASAKQLQAIELIRMLSQFPFLPAMKAILNRLGFDLGTCRLPLPALSEQQALELKRRIDAMPFLG